MLLQTESNLTAEWGQMAWDLHVLILTWFLTSQVLEVVRANYDTLTLKLQDGLDQYERYSEQHKEAAFFKELVSVPPVCACVSQGPLQSHCVLPCRWAAHGTAVVCQKLIKQLRRLLGLQLACQSSPE